MGGLSFLNIAFLGGAAVAVVPIIIHLVQRRRVQRVVFGSVRFLRTMSQRVVRRRRFTELLLIALRVLALAALAFAFARPFFSKRAARAGQKMTVGESVSLVLVDHSYSMMADDRLKKAKELAEEYLDDLDPNVKVGVAQFAAGFRMIAPPGSTLRQAKDAVKAIEQSWSGTDLFRALEWAEERLLSCEEQHRNIVLISDFQKSAWRFAEERPAARPGPTTRPGGGDLLEELVKGRKDAEGRAAGADWKLKPGIRLIVKDVAAEERAEEEKARKEREAERAEADRKRPPGIKPATRPSTTTRPAEPKARPKPPARRQRKDEFANVYIERVAVPRLALAGGLRQVISAKIVNRTPKTINDLPVVLRVGRPAGDKGEPELKEVGKDSINNLRPYSETHVSFRHDFNAPGDAVGSITLEMKPGIDDELIHDNTAYFCVPVMPRVNVLVVNGDPNKKLNRNDGFFITKALVPGTEEAPSPFEVREVKPEAFGPRDLEDVDAVLLTSVDTISAEAAAATRKFVEAGGGVGFFCGSNVRPEAFNKSLAVLAPCKLYERALEPGDDPVAISLIDFKHEIFMEFSGPRRGDFARAVFGQYFLVKESQTARKLARFSNYHPALLEESIGRGKSILFVSSADLEWNDLAVKSIFPPFIHELTRRLCGERAAGGVRTVVVDQRVGQKLGPDAKKVELVDPQGETEELKVLGGGEGEEAAAAFTPERPGLYRMQYAGGPAWFAANLAPGEPDPVRLDTKVFAVRIQSDPAAAGKRAGHGSILPKETARERAEAQQKIWMYLMGLVLLALAVEMVIAARTGTA